MVSKQFDPPHLGRGHKRRGKEKEISVEGRKPETGIT